MRMVLTLCADAKLDEKHGTVSMAHAGLREARVEAADGKTSGQLALVVRVEADAGDAGEYAFEITLSDADGRRVKPFFLSGSVTCPPGGTMLHRVFPISLKLGIGDYQIKASIRDGPTAVWPISVKANES